MEQHTPQGMFSRTLLQRQTYQPQLMPRKQLHSPLSFQLQPRTQLWLTMIHQYWMTLILVPGVEKETVAESDHIGSHQEICAGQTYRIATPNHCNCDGQQFQGLNYYSGLP